MKKILLMALLVFNISSLLFAGYRTYFPSFYSSIKNKAAEDADSFEYSNKKRKEYRITGFEQNGNALTDLKVEDALKVFNLGDSIDISFSNHEKIKDVPLYSGPFADNNQVYLKLDKNEKYATLCLNYLSVKNSLALLEEDTFVFTINTKGKYLDRQLLSSLSFSQETPKNTSQNENFALFRELIVPNMQNKTIYFSFCSLNDNENRTSFFNKALLDNNIQTILNYSDTKDELLSYFNAKNFNVFSYQSLYENNNVILSPLNSDFTSRIYKLRVASSLKRLVKLKSSKNILLHANNHEEEFLNVAILLEGLCSSSLDEIVNSISGTLKDFYNVQQDGNESVYDAFIENKVYKFIRYITNTQDIFSLTRSDIENSCRSYLKQGSMKDDDIDNLVKLIKK